MAPTLQDEDVRAVVERYFTCELATLSRSGRPVAWPTTPLFEPERGTILITASIGFPRKVFNVRRDPRVALLYSDPTGSGLSGTTEVLLQGEATCIDEILVSPTGAPRLAAWWHRAWTVQPRGRMIGADPVTRRLMDFYYRRLVLTVTPTRVHVRPALPPRPPRGRSTGHRVKPTSSEAMRRLSQYDSAVLSARDSHGAPWLLRVRPELEDGSGTLLIDVPPGEPVQAGPASLLCHRHDDQLWDLRSVAVLGDLAPRGRRWELTPGRVIPSADSSPLGMLRMVRSCRRSARAYLERRHLDPPPVDWAAYRSLKERSRQRAGAS